MNNYIIISRTYSETTPESAENGEFSDLGFIEEYRQVSFSELVSLMEKHPYPSCYPNNGDTNTWYYNSDDLVDLQTRTYREESIHFHKDNTPNAAKYWKWAAQIAGICRPSTLIAKNRFNY